MSELQNNIHGGWRKQGCQQERLGSFSGVQVVLSVSISFIFIFFFLDCTRGRGKLLGQRSNLYHSSNPLHSSDNARSLNQQGVPSISFTCFGLWGSFVLLSQDLIISFSIHVAGGRGLTDWLFLLSLVYIPSVQISGEERIWANLDQALILFQSSVAMVAGPYILFYFLFYFIFCFLGLHPGHMEIPRLGVKSEL